MHDAAKWQVVVLKSHGAGPSNCPTTAVAGLPLGAVDERRLDNVVGERGDQPLCFFLLHALDAGAVVAPDVEAPAPVTGCVRTTGWESGGWRRSLLGSAGRHACRRCDVASARAARPTARRPKRIRCRPAGGRAVRGFQGRRASCRAAAEPSSTCRCASARRPDARRSARRSRSRWRRPRFRGCRSRSSGPRRY